MTHAERLLEIARLANEAHEAANEMLRAVLGREDATPYADQFTAKMAAVQRNCLEGAND